MVARVSVIVRHWKLAVRTRLGGQPNHPAREALIPVRGVALDLFFEVHLQAAPPPVGSLPAAHLYRRRDSAATTTTIVIVAAVAAVTACTPIATAIAIAIAIITLGVTLPAGSVVIGLGQTDDDQCLIHHSPQCVGGVQKALQRRQVKSLFVVGGRLGRLVSC